MEAQCSEIPLILQRSVLSSTHVQSFRIVLSSVLNFKILSEHLAVGITDDNVLGGEDGETLRTAVGTFENSLVGIDDGLIDGRIVGADDRF